jgi:23S rRNA pseudouridine2605 synthase
MPPKKAAPKKAAAKKAPAKKTVAKKSPSPKPKKSTKPTETEEIETLILPARPSAKKKGRIETIPYEESTPAAEFPTDEELDLELEAELEAEEAAFSEDLEDDPEENEEIEEEELDDEEDDEEEEEEEDEDDESEEDSESKTPSRPAAPGKQERLQKILAAAGIASRRHAEELITEGRVQVNGETVTTLGAKADLSRDHIRVDGKLLQGAERLRYFILNKPKGFVTTVSDPEGRPTVMQFFSRLNERLYPVGRLDYQSEGLLLVTNDGPLANKLTRAESGVEKTYLVKVSGNPSDEALIRLRTGVLIPKGKPGEGHVKTAPARIRLVRAGENPWFEIVLIEGRNRELRKMFAGEGHNVEKIRRVSYGPLVLDIDQAEIRELDPSELENLRLAAEGKYRPRKIDFSVLLPKEAGRTVDHDAAKERGGRKSYTKNFRFSPRGKTGSDRGSYGNDRPAGRREGSFDRPSRPGFNKTRSGEGFHPREDRPRREEGEGFRESRGPRPGGRPGFEKRSFTPRGDKPFRPRREEGDAPRENRGPRREFRSEGAGFKRGPRREGEERSFTPRGDRPFRPRTERSGDRPEGFKPRPRRDEGDSPRENRGPRREFRSEGGGFQRGPRREGEERSFTPRGDRPFRPRTERSSEPRGERPEGSKPRSSFGSKPGFKSGSRPGGKPGGFKSGGKPGFKGKPGRKRD